jgi:hypothetical protein
MVNLFERLSAGRPPEPKPPPSPLPISWAARELLNWLQNVWKEPTVRASDIQQFGPNCIRDREIGLSAAKFLERYGWLAPMKTRQHNMKLWQVTIGPLDLSENSYRARYRILPG